ncbi:MAG: hypothetical protein U0235_34280 [Polyangiaceae bacterium]
MTADELTGLRRVLYEKLVKVFDDGVLEPHEQKELRELYGLGKLTLIDVREVFGIFLRDTWATAMADGVLEDAEKAKLRAIVEQLKLPSDLVPEDVKRAIAG